MASNPWLGVEIRHLAALSAVARERSFHGAATSLGYVQSAISQQISQLERLVGQRLVERTRGTAPVELTAAGRLLLLHADEIIARLQGAQVDMTMLAAGVPTTVRVAAGPSVAQCLLPRVLRALSGTRLGLRVIPLEKRSDTEVTDLVERGEVDVGFAEAPLRDGPFAQRELLADACVLAVPAGSPLLEPALGGGSVAMVDLGGRRHQDAVAAWLRARGHEVQIGLVTDSEATAHAFVAAGLGAAVLPRYAVEPEDRRVAAVHLDGLVPLLRLVTFWHAARQHVEALEQFAATAATAAGSVVDPDDVPLRRVT